MTEFKNVISRLKANRLWRFPGGVHPEDKKSMSNKHSIERPPLPTVLHIPLKQHIGDQGHCIVDQGDRVLKGQPLTTTYHPYAVPVHAPTSGVVKRIGEHVSAHPSGLAETTITIEADGLDEWCELTPYADYTSIDKLKLIEILCDAGISGLGGAGFPTHIKANGRKPIEFLIINGIECEPYITSDDRLMREFAWQIRQGMDILQHIIQPRAIIVAIEDNKPEAIEAMQIACNQKSDCHIASVPTVYPAGGEKQLIQVLTGREVPRDGLPEDIGTVMFNVGTCYAIADAVCNGKPLLERVVTLTGEGLAQPKNVWALLGTPVSHLVDYAGLKAIDDQNTVIMGGPMMGFTIGDPNVPVVKITNCLLVPAKNELRQGNSERPCIRCSACSDACPASLLPQQLYWHAKAKEYDKAQAYNLFDCIECGACAYVCPSDIPLVQYYRQAKSAIRNERDEKNKAEKAKTRFEARKARLEAEKAEREERHRKAAEARLAAAKNKAESSETTTANQPKPKSAAAAAAIARAKAKAAAKAGTTAKQEISQEYTDSAAEPVSKVTSPEADKKAKVAAAVARAKAKKARQEDTQTHAEPATEVTSPDDDKKAKVAAAVARAKAKKTRQEDTQALADSSAEPVSEVTSPEADKKAKVAAAVARAKAKAKARAQARQKEKGQQEK